MDELQAYAPDEIILSNLEEAALRALRACEQEYAHLRELATEIAGGFHDSISFLASLPEHRLPFLGDDPNGSSRLELLRPIYREMTTRHRILLCRELRSLIPASPDLWMDFFFPIGQEPEPSAIRRISYQKNNYTEAAFLRFSAFLHESRAAYAHSFSSVCADVYNGLSQYCILPLENSSEGRLTGFHRLIRDYEMKIVAVSDVLVDAERSTRFALLSKNLCELPGSAAFPRYFEFTTQTELYPSAEELLYAAKQCDLEIFRAEISPEGRLHATLRIGSGDLPAFLIYLAMEQPNATPIGIYADLTAPRQSK